MIVINAEGSKDVRRLKKLADSLDAADIPDLNDLQQMAPTRKQGKVSVSTLPGATISAATREALMALESTDIVLGAEYEAE
jgi:hypothetical protein